MPLGPSCGRALLRGPAGGPANVGSSAPLPLPNPPLRPCFGPCTHLARRPVLCSTPRPFSLPLPFCTRTKAVCGAFLCAAPATLHFVLHLCCLVAGASCPVLACARFTLAPRAPPGAVQGPEPQRALVDGLCACNIVLLPIRRAGICRDDSIAAEERGCGCDHCKISSECRGAPRWFRLPPFHRWVRAPLALALTI